MTAQDPRMDVAQLYREELITDRKIGTIRVLVPITAEGAVDPAREQLFVGQAQVMTPMGALPISFEIPGKTLAEAVAAYAGGLKQAIAETERELHELRRQAASSIVIPEGGANALKGFGGKGPGGGLQIP
jgi:hypothetical protein